jgi:hypothetical protein
MFTDIIFTETLYVCKKMVRLSLNIAVKALRLK